MQTDRREKNIKNLYTFSREFASYFAIVSFKTLILGKHLTT